MSFNDDRMDIDRDLHYQLVHGQRLPQSAYQQHPVQQPRPIHPVQTPDFDDLAHRLERFGGEGGEASTRAKGKTRVRGPPHRLTLTTRDTQDDDDDNSDGNALDLSKWTEGYVKASPYKLPKLRDYNLIDYRISVHDFTLSRLSIRMRAPSKATTRFSKTSIYGNLGSIKKKKLRLIYGDQKTFARPDDQERWHGRRRGWIGPIPLAATYTGSVPLQDVLL